MLLIGGLSCSLGKVFLLLGVNEASLVLANACFHVSNGLKICHVMMVMKMMHGITSNKFLIY